MSGETDPFVIDGRRASDEMAALEVSGQLN
jgi:hypothetical protein